MPVAPGEPWHPDHAQTRFRKMVRAVGLPAYTLHSLRHFVATQLLIEGQPINQVAEFLGHTPQMTLMLYGRHLDREAMRRVGRAATMLVQRPSPAVRPSDAADSDEPMADPASPRSRAPIVEREVAESMVLELARAGPITNAAVRAETGLTRRQVSRALDRLVQDGRLIRRGSRRGSYYVACEEPDS